MKPLLVLLATLTAGLAAPTVAAACQLDDPPSSLEHLYGASSVIYGDVVEATQDGFLVRRIGTISGTHKTDVTLPYKRCGALQVGDRVAVAIPGRTSLTFPVALWPEDPENQALIIAFANAKNDVEIGKVLAAYVNQGCSSYVDFPQIALFLQRTPSVVKTLGRREAKALLRDLSQHPRAKLAARAALTARAK